MDLYEILEIKNTASTNDIKKAYYRLAKIYHPDKNNDIDKDNRFQKIQSAYEILRDDKTRQEYQKMNDLEKTSFIDIFSKIINKNVNIDELKKYGINLEKNDVEYIQKNIINFFSTLNIKELLDLIKNGNVPHKDSTNTINCSDSDIDLYDESMGEYFYSLPFNFLKRNKNDINIDLIIKIGDIVNNNKKKIKIIKKVDDADIPTTFVFNLSKPYIIYVGGGDIYNGDYGNLVIKLSLPNNVYWDENMIVIEHSMNLYEMVYGLDINIDLGDLKEINIQKWVPCRDGFLIELSNDTLISEYNVTIKLILNYESTDDKEQLLKEYFSI